jgi:hypothetical protein
MLAGIETFESAPDAAEASASGGDASDGALFPLPSADATVDAETAAWADAAGDADRTTPPTPPAPLPPGCACTTNSCPSGKYCWNGQYCLTPGEAPPGWSCTSKFCQLDGHDMCFYAGAGCAGECAIGSNDCGRTYGCNYRVN